MKTTEGLHQLTRPVVSYFCYGSNLKRSRFMTYLCGGRPPGAETVINPGARDQTPPLDSRPVRLNYELYFAGHSKWWNAAPAFIRPARGDEFTYGRSYRIFYDQFNDVVAQECGKPVDGSCLVPPLGDLVRAKEFELPGNLLYGRLLYVGDDNGFPLLSFTTNRKLAAGPPSRPYLKIIISGLRETYQMTDAEICDYLGRASGISLGGVDAQELAEWVRESD